MLQVLI